MTTRLSKAGKLAALGIALASAVAMPLSASARDWGDHGHHDGYRGGYGHGYYGHGYYGHDRDGHWSGGRWIAGALVTGAVIGLVSDALRPAPVYYGPPVVYTQPRTVYYEEQPVVRRRVVSRTVIYDNPYPIRYYGRSYDDDDGD